MKAEIYLLGALLTLLCACGSKAYPHVLTTADSLTSANPDSAQALLASLTEG